MNSKLLVVVGVVLLSTGMLVYKASTASAKTVVTVNDLVSEGSDRPLIRLGARVSSAKIDYKTKPQLTLKFFVKDVEGAAEIPVVYKGVKPDTLQPGRDVILEGDFDKGVFQASTLMTQCPSKYEPPSLGDSYEDTK